MRSPITFGTYESNALSERDIEPRGGGSATPCWRSFSAGAARCAAWNIAVSAVGRKTREMLQRLSWLSVLRVLAVLGRALGARRALGPACSGRAAATTH